jgi:tetratricopeptide (TPR) repeat protein
MRVTFAMLSVLVSFAVLACCQGEKAADTSQRGALTALTEPENALSEELMLSLGQAKNFHHKADVFMSDGKLSEAADAVAKIMDIPFPKDAPESEDALLDTQARLAKLRLAQGRLDEAMKLVDDGIATASRQSFFLANVHTVRGEIFEATAEAAEAGSEANIHAKVRALEAFDTSIQINDVLLEQLKTEP